MLRCKKDLNSGGNNELSGGNSWRALRRKPAKRGTGVWPTELTQLKFDQGVRLREYVGFLHTGVLGIYNQPQSGEKSCKTLKLNKHCLEAILHRPTGESFLFCF